MNSLRSLSVMSGPSMYRQKNPFTRIRNEVAASAATIRPRPLAWFRSLIRPPGRPYAKSPASSRANGEPAADIR